MAIADSMFCVPGWLAAIALTGLPMTIVSAQDRGSVTIEQLQDELAQRDAIIIDLMNRVRALEQGQIPQRGAAAEAAAAVPTATDIAAEPDARAASDGDFEIDALAAERALERGLVQEGARLLGAGQFEIEPAFAVSLRDGMFPTALMSGNDTVVGEISRTLEVHERRTDFRVGLPWRSQLEIGLPYVTVNQKLETGIDGGVQSTMEEFGSGLGDATIGFSKVLAVESGARPNLVARLAWLAGNGDERDGAVALGGGFSGFAGRLSPSWRRDPVVLLLSGGYTRYDDDLDLMPGNSFELSFGLGMAVSPETALIVSLNQLFAEEFKRGGITLDGTDRLASTLDLAVSTTLGRRLYLRGYTTAGLTDESPDYGFGISVSSRLQMR